MSNLTPKEWKIAIRMQVAQIADKDYQRRAWFGLGPEVSSVEEMFCGLFDDLLLDDFLDCQNCGLTTRQRTAGKRLARLMNEYASTLDAHPDPEGVVDDPAWVRIRLVAKDFADALDGTN